MRTEIIVSSKSFRNFLKAVEQASRARYLDNSEVLFQFDKDKLNALNNNIYVTKRGLAFPEHKVKVDSIVKAIKVLKHAPEQPIKVGFEDTWSALNIQCVF